MQRQIEGGFALPIVPQTTTEHSVPIGALGDTPNARKRPWPFEAAADDRSLSFNGRVSPSVRQNSETFYLLGSVSYAILLRTL